MVVDQGIFRAYDIRGIVTSALTPNVVQQIGKALGTLAAEKNETTIIVGRDGRLSSEALSESLIAGILSVGCHVIDIGLVPTPLLYFATHHLMSRSGVMMTGSHNPPEYNGLKMIIAGQILAQEQIQAIYHRIISQQFSEGKGTRKTVSVTEAYLSEVSSKVKIAKKLKIVVDGGNGAASIVGPLLYERMGCDVDRLFCEIDGTFPNHHPDPTQVENLSALIKRVKELKADVGLAFDGDGDRLGVVTSEGSIIWADRQLILFARSILSKQKGKIIFDVKCSDHVASSVQAAGGTPIMWKTGHSFIKAKLAETNALLAGEMSGHLFFNDNWYGFDDGIFAGARLLEILAASEMQSHGVFQTIPDSINTPELKVSIADNEKFKFMDALLQKANFENAKVETIDGLRVSFADGWGIVRPSNTTPCLILRFEAKSKAVLSQIQMLFKTLMLSLKPDLVFPF